MATSHSDLASEIKSRLTMTEVATQYGYTPSRSGFICCPFHGEKTPSLKIYDGDRGFSCFGCHKSGSVIDFVMELFGLDFRQACLRLNDDFRLGLSSDRPDKKTVSEAVRKRQEEQRKRDEAEQYETELAEAFYQNRRIVEFFGDSPTKWDYPEYIRAANNLHYLKYLEYEREKARWLKSKKAQ